MRFEEAAAKATKRAIVQGRAFITTNLGAPGGFDVTDFRHLGVEDDNPEGWVSLFYVTREGDISDLNPVGMRGWDSREEGRANALRISGLPGLEVTGFALVETTDKEFPFRLFAHSDFQASDLTDPTEKDRFPLYPPHVEWFSNGEKVA